MGNNRVEKRFLCIVIFIAVLILVCIVRLFDLQVVKGDSYRQQAEERLIRAYPVKAPRGEIVDCNGEALVANRLAYYVQMQRVDMDNDQLNEILYRVLELVDRYGGEINTSFPIVYNEEAGQPEYQFDVDESAIAAAYLVEPEENEDNTALDQTTMTDTEGEDPEAEGQEADETAEQDTEVQLEDVEAAPTQTQQKIRQAIDDKKNQLMTEWEEENELTRFETLRQIFEYYKNRYSVAGKYAEADAARIMAIRYEMEQQNFSATNPFAIATDVDEQVVQQIKEQSMDFPGVSIEIETKRAYPNGTMAAHILGRTGKIYAEEYEQLSQEGYGMDDTIGKDGLEKVLEPYLRGEDGYKSIELSKAGGVTQILQNQPPKPGKYAQLTLDAELQQAMEDSLEKNITAAVGEGGAGAAIAVDPDTGEVLAMASYPAYNPATFSEEYDDLLEQEGNPLFNRALNGTYSPGSTFKVLSAIAGLESGVIDRYSTITDRGRYTYYSSYQPTCLVYSSTGATHGTINVSEAIGVSCNYFFYELGRLTTIETLDEYCEKFGLGETTGIELQESAGRVAGPEEREAAGGTWYPGDTLQAAIGQSDNLFTPAQLASYISTFLNKGKRYALHLIDQVVDYDTGEVVYQKEPEVLSDNPIFEDTYEAVKDGMRRVVEDGTARSVFSDIDFEVGGKTGTAQVSDGADNVLFTGFAPYDEPEIVVAAVIEHGASSSYAAQIAKDVFDAYMTLKEDRKDPNYQSTLRSKNEDGDDTPAASASPRPRDTDEEDEDPSASADAQPDDSESTPSPRPTSPRRAALYATPQPSAKPDAARDDVETEEETIESDEE